MADVDPRTTLPTRIYVCDCGRTQVTIEPPADLPEAAEYLQCDVCGTHVKHYPVWDEEAA